jgi:hypothetical protein
MTPPPRSPRRPRPALAAAVAVILAGVASAAVSWQCWINPFIDSGREMDVAARLAAGERLYRDVDFYYGPLGPWMAGAAVRFAGRHWWVLETMNAVLAAAILALLYRLTVRAGSARSALLATAFGAALVIGAPNGGAFLFPYSSDNLWALAGGLLAIDSLRESGSWRRRAAGALGLAAALAARFELGVAMAAALLACGLLVPPRRDLAAGLRESSWRLGLGAAGALAAYAVAFGGLAFAPLIEAGPLTHFFALPAEWRRMYSTVAGFTQPGKAALRLGAAVLLDAGLLAAAALTASPRLRWPAGERGRRLLWGLLVGAGLLLLAAEPRGRFPGFPGFPGHPGHPGWRAALPPLLFPVPLLAAGAAVWAVWRGVGGRKPDPALEGTAGAVAATERQAARFLLFAATAVVSARVVLGLQVGPEMSPYSALPLPLLAATACVLVFDMLGERLPDPAAFRHRAGILLAAAALLFLYQLARLDWRANVGPVATPAGPLRLRFGEAVAVDEALAYLAAHALPGDTLAAFPEGGFFNFVTGLRNPLREEQVFPGVLAGPREIAAARRLELARPRFVLLCNRPTREYGPVRFGTDYAVELWRRVERLYVPTAVFGVAPESARPGARRFLIRLFEPRSAARELNAPPSASDIPSEAEKGPAAASAARRRKPRSSTPACRSRSGTAGRPRLAAHPRRR